MRRRGEFGSPAPADAASTGALYQTEAYVVAGAVEGLLGLWLCYVGYLA